MSSASKDRFPAITRKNQDMTIRGRPRHFEPPTGSSDTHVPPHTQPARRMDHHMQANDGPCQNTPKGRRTQWTQVRSARQEYRHCSKDPRIGRNKRSPRRATSCIFCSMAQLLWIPYHAGIDNQPTSLAQLANLRKRRFEAPNVMQTYYATEDQHEAALAGFMREDADKNALECVDDPTTRPGRLQPTIRLEY